MRTRVLGSTAVLLVALAPIAGPADAAAAHHYVVNIRCAKGLYVVAEGGGGGPVNANRPKASVWEQFVLVDVDGGALQHGDAVRLRTWDGRWVGATPAGALVADRAVAGTWETFTIVRASGTGTIGNGTGFALRGAGGRFVTAEFGGGGTVRADRLTLGPWETFTFSVLSQSTTDPSPLKPAAAPTAPTTSPTAAPTSTPTSTAPTPTSTTPVPTSTPTSTPTSPPTSTTAAPTNTGYIPPEPSSGVRESLSQSDIMQVVLLNKPAIVQCTNEQKKKDPGLGGKLVMQWTIQTSGKTTGVQAVTPEFKTTYLASCLSGLIRGWSFPKHLKQGPPIQFPFTF